MESFNTWQNVWQTSFNPSETYNAMVNICLFFHTEFSLFSLTQVSVSISKVGVLDLHTLVGLKGSKLIATTREAISFLTQEISSVSLTWFTLCVQVNIVCLANNTWRTLCK